jgi:hypothetical protein
VALDPVSTKHISQALMTRTGSNVTNANWQSQLFLDFHLVQAMVRFEPSNTALSVNCSNGFGRAAAAGQGINKFDLNLVNNVLFYEQQVIANQCSRESLLKGKFSTVREY